MHLFLEQKILAEYSVADVKIIYIRLCIFLGNWYQTSD